MTFLETEALITKKHNKVEKQSSEQKEAQKKKKKQLQIARDRPGKQEKCITRH